MRGSLRPSQELSEAAFRSVYKPAPQGVLVYSGLFVLLLCLFNTIGKDLINNPIRSGVTQDPYGEWYQLIRYLEFALVAGLAIISPPGTVSRMVQMNAHLLPFLAIVIMSLFWSVDKWTTGRYSLLLIGFFFTVSFLADRLGPVSLTSGLLNFLAGVLIASAAMAIFMPAIGRHSASDVSGLAHLGKWRGIFSYKNGLGAYAGVGAVLFFTHGKMLTSSQSYLWLARISAVLCLVFAKSSNANLGAVSMLFLYFFLKQKRPLSLGVILTIFIVFGVVLSSLSGVVAAMLGRDETFTGRTVIWDRVLEVWRDSPWLGYGYYAGNENVLMPQLIGGVFESAVDSHNGYLDLLIDLGAIGLAAFIFGALCAFKIGHQSFLRSVGDDRSALAAMLMVLLAACVMAMAEVTPFRLVGYGGSSGLFTLVALAAFRDRPFFRKAARRVEKIWG